MLRLLEFKKEKQFNLVSGFSEAVRSRFSGWIKNKIKKGCKISEALQAGFKEHTI